MLAGERIELEPEVTDTCGDLLIRDSAGTWVQRDGLLSIASSPYNRRWVAGL